MFQVTIPAADVNILDTWYVAGLTTVGPATNCADQETRDSCSTAGRPAECSRRTPSLTSGG